MSRLEFHIKDSVSKTETYKKKSHVFSTIPKFLVTIYFFCFMSFFGFNGLISHHILYAIYVKYIAFFLPESCDIILL